MDFRQLQSDYERDGYLVIEDFIDSELLESLCATTNEYFALARSGQLEGDSNFDVIRQSDGSLELRRMVDPQKRSPVYDRAMRYPPLVELIGHLLGGTVRFDHAKLNNKPPLGGGKIEWHQDFAYYPQTNDDMLAIGIAIEDCNVENGAMMVIPGSHILPMFSHHQNGQFVGGVSKHDLNGLTDDAVTLTGAAGAITIHHARTLHASRANQTTKPRPFLVLNYFSVDAFPIFFSYDWEEFNSRILVGDVTFAPRYKPVDCRLPLPAQIQDENGDYLTGSLFQLQEQMESPSLS